MNKPTPGAMRASEEILKHRRKAGEVLWPREREINIMAQIIDDETGLADLLATMRNALATIKIMQLPVSGPVENVASNAQLLDIMADSFETAFARSEGHN